MNKKQFLIIAVGVLLSVGAFVLFHHHDSNAAITTKVLSDDANMQKAVAGGTVAAPSTISLVTVDDPFTGNTGKDNLGAVTKFMTPDDGQYGRITPITEYEHPDNTLVLPSLFDMAGDDYTPVEGQPKMAFIEKYHVPNGTTISWDGASVGNAITWSPDVPQITAPLGSTIVVTYSTDDNGQNWKGKVDLEKVAALQ